MSRWRTSDTLIGTSPPGVFFSPRWQNGDGQHRVSQHGQRDVRLPALPVATFVVVQSTLALCCLEALFDPPALPGHGQEFPMWPRLWARKTNSAHTRAVAQYCAAPAVRGSSHPLPNPGSESSRKAVRFCCPSLRRHVSMPNLAKSAQLHPRTAVHDPTSESIGLKI